MQRRFLLVLSLLLACSLVPTKASAAVESFKFKGGSAVAGFLMIDPNDPCISTRVVVVVTEGRIKEEDGKVESVTDLSANIFRYNECTFEVFINVFTPGLPQAEEFVIDKDLNSATLHSSVDLCNYDTGECFPAEFNLDWSATGKTIKEKEKTKVDLDAGKCKLHLNLTWNFREAVATGSVTIPGETIALQSPYYARVADVQQGQAEINCE